MKSYTFLYIAIFLFLFGCSQNTITNSLIEMTEGVPHIRGKEAYLESPYVTAGDRVYMVGHQDGSFPEIGWHIKGEMGGIWNHPIKLMDGFEVELRFDGLKLPLKGARSFINYPFANSHEYHIEDKNLSLIRLQFVPDGKQGLMVQYLLKNDGDSEQTFNLTFTGHSDLRPTWLGERTQMIDGRDVANYLESRDAWLLKDEKNEWYTIFGADEKSVGHDRTENGYGGLGDSNDLTYTISIQPKSSKTIDFTIAGSYRSKDEAIATFDDIQTNAVNYFEQKKARYEKLADQSKLTIPDKDIQQAFEWLKYNCDWLVQTVPEIGTGITAGIPDYPWWFGVDSEYALKGYMAIGQQEAAYSTIELLDSVSNAVNGNGKIIHEMSTNGTVFNDGNINETPQFASLIWEAYRWNGDKGFIQKYWPTIKKGMQWLMDENDSNGNLFPDGFGMMEIHGLDSEMVDVAVYTQRAFSDASKIALELGDKKISDHYRKIADTLETKINNEFWSAEFDSYADFLGTDTQALHLIEDAIVRADTLKKPWAIAELESTKKKLLANPSKTLKPFVLHHNWVVNTPMEMKIADSAKAIKALNTAEKFVNPFGVFVTGIDRDESAGSDDGSFRGSKMFSYTGAVMTLPTGVQIVAENNYGRPDNALNYMKRMTRTFSYALPGSIYEVSPDYGMMTQAWNIYSYAIPIVQQFFGIQPDAAHKRVVIKPQMPSEWNSASLKNVAVANNRVSISYEETDGIFEITLRQTEPDWTMELILPDGAIPDQASAKGNFRTTTSGEHIGFMTEDKEFRLQWK